jgi:CxxC motif-containing protein
MKETRQLTCISCPMGCPLTVEMENGVIVNVLGYTCRRGEEYARKEVTNPRRTLTSVIPVLNGEIDMVSVKTRTDIPKPMVRECILALKIWKSKLRSSSAKSSSVTFAEPAST